MLVEAADTPKPPRSALKPAAENPWYVLATIYGEQTGEKIDKDLHARNRRFWNGWHASSLSQFQQEFLAKNTNFEYDELAPLSDSEVSELNLAFSKRKMEIPSPREIIDLRSTVFIGLFDISGFMFSADVSFEDSLFTRLANFNLTAFCGESWFDGAKFQDAAIFTSAQFAQRAAFRDVSFNGMCSFDSARFNAKVDFNSSIFCCFTKYCFTAFDETAFFQKVRFSDIVHFDNAIFNGSIYFNDAMFLNGCLFTDAKFNKEADFHSALFGGDAVFHSIRAGGFAHFEKAVFDHGIFFSESDFDRPASFREARFSARFPDLTGTILHPNTGFTAKDAFWPGTHNAPAEESRESLAIIRHAVGKQGLPEEEHYFFRREMAFAARIGSPLQRLPYQAFGTLSDFGYSLAKPVLWLGLVGYFGLVVYWNWLAWYAPDNLDFAGPFRTGAGFSVAQLFGFLGFTGSYFRDLLDVLPWQLKVVGGCQTVAGVVLLFFLGLGLRNRFRLK